MDLRRWLAVLDVVRFRVKRGRQNDFRDARSLIDLVIGFGLRLTDQSEPDRKKGVRSVRRIGYRTHRFRRGQDSNPAHQNRFGLGRSICEVDTKVQRV